MCVCVWLCVCIYEEEEIEMQQSSECDSSRRLCMDLDAIESTYRGKCMFMCAHVHRCVYMPC